MIQRSARGAMEIEAQLNAPGARVQLVHYHFPAPPESTLRVEGRIRVELCLTVRHPSARACFSDHWAASRFERIGDLFVLPPDQAMRAKSDDSNSLTSVVCELDLEPMLELLDHRPPALTEQHLLASLDVRHAKIQSLLLQLAEEAKQPGFASEMLTECLATQMEVELLELGISPGQFRQILLD
jgi:AraC family transcriptional regulator